MAGAKVIVKAWYKVLQGKTTEEHIRRSEICKECPSAKYNFMLDFIDDKLVESKGMLCSECGCPLSAKIRSTDKCIKWLTPTN